MFETELEKQKYRTIKKILQLKFFLNKKFFYVSKKE